jgi:iron complex transport system substrate-binding protein
MRRLSPAVEAGDFFVFRINIILGENHLYRHRKISINSFILKLAMFLALIMVIAGCSNANSTITTTNGSEEISFPLTITDDLGRTVVLEKIPQRIVSLAPSNTEIIYALGLEERLVGVTEWCDYPPEAQTKEKVGGYSDIDMEKVVSLEPDLVLAEDIHKQDVIPALERMGIPCFALVPHNLNEITNSVLVIGKLTGTGEKAQQIASDMQRRIEYVSEKTAGLKNNEKPRVMYVIWEDMMSVGVDTPIHEMITIAGGVNIVKGLEGFPTLSLEEIIGSNPQVVIANVEDYPGGDAPLQAVLKESRLKTIDAVTDGRVFGISASLTNRPVPRIVDGLEWMAAIIHPELFPEFVEKYGLNNDT